MIPSNPLKGLPPDERAAAECKAAKIRKKREKSKPVELDEYNTELEAAIARQERIDDAAEFLADNGDQPAETDAGNTNGRLVIVNNGDVVFESDDRHRRIVFTGKIRSKGETCIDGTTTLHITGAEKVGFTKSFAKLDGVEIVTLVPR